ncbi:virion structural protein [Vibrio phage K394]
MAEIQDIGYQLNLVEGATTSVDATQPTELVNYRTAQAILANQTNVKDAAMVATIANIDLAVGGLLVVDGYQTVEGDRVLVKSQTDASQNGIYTASSGAWVRTTDADENGEIVTGMQVFVYNDGTHAGHGHIYVMNSADPVVIGTDAINFVASQAVTGHADDLAVDDGAFSVLTGTNAQAALDSADNAIQANLDSVTALDTRLDNLSGVAGSDLGAFTGSTIADNTDVKSALQALETKAESDTGIYAANKAVLTSQTNTAGTWTTVTHNLNEAELSSVSFFDEGNSLQNMNSAVLWRPKSGDANSIEIYHGQAKTFKIVFRV